jgi:hypothetical protein
MWQGCCKKTLLLSICCWQLTAAASAQGPEDLAAQWAPTIEQSFNTAGNSSQANPAQEDTSTVFNFDLDWRANNNWDNLNYYKLKPPAVYYSVVEAAKFYYLGYYFYYPRHVGAKAYANDFSGLAIVLEKLPAPGQGRLAGVLLYDDGGWQEISLLELRSTDSPVRVSISAGEHAIALREEASPPLTNIITCEPRKKGQAVTPEGTSSRSYQLVALDELWRHRGEITAGEAYGTLNNKANPGDLKDLPWRWQYKGVRWLSDPAGVFRLISGLKTPSGSYLYNPYAE